MAYLNSRVLDFGVNEVSTNGGVLYICSTEPATYAEAITTYALGSKSAPTISAPAAGSPTGRQVNVTAISDGTVSTTGTATSWAIVDAVNSRLVAANSLASNQAVTAGNPFTLTGFSIRLPAPA